MAVVPARVSRADVSNGTRLFNWVCGTVVTFFALIWLVPFVWAIITSLRPDADIVKNPVSIFGGGWSLDAYRQSWTQNPIGWWYVNSLIVSVLSVLFTVVLGSMCGFALTHLRFRGRNLVIGIIAIGLMIPTEALVLPQFIEYRAIGLLGTYWALVIPSVAAPVSVFIFMTFFKTLPTSLIEAARMDGAGWWRIYRTIAMPLVRPAVSAVAIMTFIASWNQFLWPLLVLSQTKTQTVPVGLGNLINPSTLQPSMMMATGVLGFLPMIAAFLIFQRRITEGVATTGIK